MALNASKVAKSSGGKDIEPIEVGNYPARLVQVLDLGLQAQRPYQGKEKPPAHEVMLTYELVSEFMKDDDGEDMEDKPRWISETMPLRHIEQDLAKSTKRIKAIDPTMSKGGDFAEMVGMPCTITITHNPNKKEPGKVYVNVGNVTPPMKGFVIPELVNPPKVFDLSKPDLEVLGSLPEWLQGKIKDNLEFNGSKLAGLLGSSPAQEEAEDDDEAVESPY